MVPSGQRALLRDKLGFLKSATKQVIIPDLYRRYLLPDGRFDFPQQMPYFWRNTQVNSPEAHLPQVAIRFIASIERCITLNSLDPFSRDIQNLLQVPASRWQNMRLQMAAQVDRLIQEVKSTPELEQVMQRFH